MKSILCLWAMIVLTVGSLEAASADLNYQMDLGYLNQGQYDKARIALEKAARKDPKNPQVYESLGEAYLGLHQDDKALKTFLKCLDLDPTNKAAVKFFTQLAAKLQNPSSEPESPQPWDKTKRIEFQFTYGIPSWPGPGNNSYPWVGGGQSLGVWLGYDFNEHAALGIRMDYFWYSANPADFIDSFLPNQAGNYASITLDTGGLLNIVQLVPTFKLNFNLDENRLAPYLFTGAGLLNESMKSTYVRVVTTNGGGEGLGTVPGFSQNSFIGLVGVGLPFEVAKDTEITVEAYQTFGFSDSQPFSYYNVDAGLLFHL